MVKIALILAEGFEEVEAVTPADFLDRAGVKVFLTGVTGKTVKGAHGITIAADCTLEELPGDIDGVIIPGGMPGSANVASSSRAIALIKKINREGKLVAAICAAPAIVLEKAGVLEGKKATCFPGMENRLTNSTFSNERVVVDGNIITSRAPGTAAEFALTLVEILAGKEAAEKIYKDTLQNYRV
ncbi:MAG: DJ-1/PfpI family protein [Spirochaetales bacterium]|nr:DJ-1/PfpI family protein [Spirochaetales bacterium]